MLTMNRAWFLLLVVMVMGMTMSTTYAQSTDKMIEYGFYESLISTIAILAIFALMFTVPLWLVLRSENQGGGSSPKTPADAKALADILQALLSKRRNIMAVVVIPLAIMVFGIILAETILDLIIRPWFGISD